MKRAIYTLISSAFPDHALYLMHYRGYGGSTGQRRCSAGGERS
ncbi:MAG TPA: hypothetical protein VJN01_05370 [Xanthomonadales bacterium]|nr:hypothetical protein [Xanthomonadales bacterium]